jgi:hypothetical protein
VLSAINPVLQCRSERADGNIDSDHDGWPDIYFTNAQSVEMALHGVKARSVLFTKQTFFLPDIEGRWIQ